MWSICECGYSFDSLVSKQSIFGHYRLRYMESCSWSIYISSKTVSEKDLKHQFPLYRFYTSDVHVFILIPNQTHFLPEGFLHYLKPKRFAASVETVCSFITPRGSQSSTEEQRRDSEVRPCVTLAAMCRFGWQGEMVKRESNITDWVKEAIELQRMWDKCDFNMWIWLERGKKQWNVVASCVFCVK